MAVITITSAAKCKDCKFMFGFKKGKLKRHACGNFNSEHHEESRRLNDLVCSDWKIN